VIVLVDLTVVRDIVTIVGVIVAFTYYVLTVRATQRNQQHQLETRQTQLFMQLYQDLLSENNMRSLLDLLNMEWEDYDDFERKLGSDNNPDSFVKRTSIWFRMNGIGLLLRDEMINPEKVFDLLGTWIIWLWMKWETIIQELRVRYNQPEIYAEFEYLAIEMKRIRLRRGITDELPNTFTRYVPEDTQS
jgi:hypothetical protein